MNLVCVKALVHEAKVQNNIDLNNIKRLNEKSKIVRSVKAVSNLRCSLTDIFHFT